MNMIASGNDCALSRQAQRQSFYQCSGDCCAAVPPGAGRATASAASVMAMAARIRAAVETETEVEEKIKEAFGKGWAIIVWNDPINLMSYVAHVFQIVLKMKKEDATRHMLEVHHKGKSVVGIETREQAEFLVHRLQSYGLHATMEAM